MSLKNISDRSVRKCWTTFVTHFGVVLTGIPNTDLVRIINAPTERRATRTKRVESSLMENINQRSQSKNFLKLGCSKLLGISSTSKRNFRKGERLRISARLIMPIVISFERFTRSARVPSSQKDRVISSIF